MKAISFITGIVLLFLAVGGVVCWITGFEIFRQMLLDDAPVFFDNGSTHWQFSGRLVGMVVLAVPIISAAAGITFLISGFSSKAANDA